MLLRHDPKIIFKKMNELTCHISRNPTLPTRDNLLLKHPDDTIRKRCFGIRFAISHDKILIYLITICTNKKMTYEKPKKISIFRWLTGLA